MRQRYLAVLALGLALACAGCGSIGPEEGGSDGPIRFVGLWEVKGESAVSIDDYQNGAQMALEEINAAGGIDGRKVELDRVPLDVVDPQKAAGQFLQALDKDPDVMLGFPAASGLLAAKSQIDRGGVPLISQASASEPNRYGSSGASQWTYLIRAADADKVDVGIKYATESLDATKIATTGTNNTYGLTNTEAVAEELAKLNLEPYATRIHEPTATDLTQDVLAMKDADVILSYAQPNPLAILLKQLVQNGIEVPTITGATASIVVNGKLATGEAIANLYQVSDCGAGTPGTPEGDFLDAYRAKFNSVPGDLALAASTYDAMWVAKAAIEKAGTAEPEAVRKALGEVTVTENIVCSDEYKADGSHIFNHNLVVSRFDKTGTATEVERLTTPPREKAED